MKEKEKKNILFFPTVLFSSPSHIICCLYTCVRVSESAFVCTRACIYVCLCSFINCNHLLISVSDSIAFLAFYSHILQPIILQQIPPRNQLPPFFFILLQTPEDCNQLFLVSIYKYIIERKIVEPYHCS